MVSPLTWPRPQTAMVLACKWVDEVVDRERRPKHGCTSPLHITVVLRCMSPLFLGRQSGRPTQQLIPLRQRAVSSGRGGCC